MNLPKQLRAVRVYSFTSCLRLTDAVWVALLAARGFTLAQIGLAEAVFHLTSLLCEVPSGVAADLLGRRLNLAVSAVFEIFSDVTMAFSPNLAAVCAAMALKALACTMISGTLEALTYDSLKTAGRENEYLQADAKISVLQKLATALGSLASLLSDVLQFAGFYLANAAICFCSLLAALTLQEPLVTEAQAARQQNPFADIAARLRVHITDSAAVLRTTPLAVRLITAQLPDHDVCTAAAGHAGVGCLLAVRLSPAGLGCRHGMHSAGTAAASREIAPAVPTVCPGLRRWCAVGRGRACLGLPGGADAGAGIVERVVPARDAAVQ